MMLREVNKAWKLSWPLKGSSFKPKALAVNYPCMENKTQLIDFYKSRCILVRLGQRGWQCLLSKWRNKLNWCRNLGLNGPFYWKYSLLLLFYLQSLNFLLSFTFPPRLTLMTRQEVSKRFASVAVGSPNSVFLHFVINIFSSVCFLILWLLELKNYVLGKRDQ